MAASDTELFFELTGSAFVQSAEAPNIIANPLFYHGDIKPILLKLLRRISPTQVEVVDLTGVTVQMAVGTPAVSPTVITSATSGIVDSNGFLPIDLPFNVAAVATALGTSYEINPYIELRVLFGSNPQRYQTKCTLRQRLITDTLADPTPPGVAVTLEEVLALCVPRDGTNAEFPCSEFLMIDSVTGDHKRVVLENGELHVVPA